MSRNHAPSHGQSRATSSGAAPPGDWLSLTDLGRLYGVSAVHAGKLLHAAGLRLAGGEPTPEAIASGLALKQHAGHHHQALWSRQGCASHLEGQGLEAQKPTNLVSLWADLLAALQQGSPAIATSAEEMAGEMPSELVRPVNRELRQRGCSFQVSTTLRRAAGPRPACSPAPASDAAEPHRCD